MIRLVLIKWLKRRRKMHQKGQTTERTLLITMVHKMKMKRMGRQKQKIKRPTRLQMLKTMNKVKVA